MSQYYIISHLTSYTSHRNRKPLFYYFWLWLLTIALETSQNSAWISDGLCAETLGNGINSFIDKCFGGNSFFRSMRNGHLRDLYKVNCCPGYTLISRMRGEIMCKPVCKRTCIGGTCIKPDTCQCKRGYFQKNPYECLPLCQPTCKNGDCIGIDLCKCKPGYRLSKGSKNECEPVCEECINGLCVSPGVCRCVKGFVMKKDSINECEPYCEPSCINATCTASGQCQCLLGYERGENSSCIPVCKKGCGLGVCSAPEICSCPEGYKSNHEKPCQPKCKGCTIGSCVSPNICYCPEGYTLNIETNECDPVCPNCMNGLCVKPNECVCNPGYTKVNGAIQCKPFCNPRCINGLCNEPGFCQCYEGFKLKSNSSNECEPVCSKICINSTCVAPETCRCVMGYEQISTNSCRPICAEGCGPGVCILPNHCECPKGYFADSGRSCQPICSTECKNGHCVAPEVCICSPDHSRVNGVCEPVCDKNCVNSYCTSSNVCECFNGFIRTSDSECVPQCSSGCINGHCSSPETCSCYPGFNSHPEDSSICLRELQPYSSPVSTPFLNIYNIPYIVAHSDDNKTFNFDSVILSVNTSCNTIFQNYSDNNSTNGETDSLWILCQPTESVNKSNIKLYCHWPSTDDYLDNINDNFNLNNTSNSLISHNNTEESSHLLDLTIFIIFSEEYSNNHTGLCAFSFQPSLPSKEISLSESSFFTVTIVKSTNSSADIHSLLEAELPYTWILIMITIILIATMTGLILKLMVQSPSRNLMERKVELDDMSCKRESEENGTNAHELMNSGHEIIDDIGKE